MGHIDAMGEDAADMIHPAITNALGISVTIIFLSRQDGAALRENPFYPDNADQSLPTTCTVLGASGHFEVAYKWQHSEWKCTNSKCNYLYAMPSLQYPTKNSTCNACQSLNPYIPQYDKHQKITVGNSTPSSSSYFRSTPKKSPVIHGEICDRVNSNSSNGSKGSSNGSGSGSGGKGSGTGGKGSGSGGDVTIRDLEEQEEKAARMKNYDEAKRLKNEIETLRSKQSEKKMNEGNEDTGNDTEWYPTLKGTYCVRWLDGDNQDTCTEINQSLFLNDTQINNLMSRSSSSSRNNSTGKNRNRNSNSGHGGNSGSTKTDDLPVAAVSTSGPIEISNRVKVLWNNGRWYQGTVIDLFEAGGESQGMFRGRAPIIQMPQIEYDDGDVKDARLSRCQIYHGLLTTTGLYFTEGDPVTIHNEMGRTYDAEGVVTAIEEVVT